MTATSIDPDDDAADAGGGHHWWKDITEEAEKIMSKPVVRVHTTAATSVTEGDLDQVPFKGWKMENPGSNTAKFWRIRRAGRRVETWWGRIGTDGQRKVKEFLNPQGAILFCHQIQQEKRAKGYFFDPDFNWLPNRLGSSPPTTTAPLADLKMIRQQQWNTYVRDFRGTAINGGGRQEVRRIRSFGALVEVESFSVDRVTLKMTPPKRECFAYSNAECALTRVGGFVSEWHGLGFGRGSIAQGASLVGREGEEAGAKRRGRVKASAPKPKAPQVPKTDVALGRFSGLGKSSADQDDEE